MNSDNAAKVLEETGCKEIHSTCKKMRLPNLRNKFDEQDGFPVSDEDEIRKLLQSIRKFEI